MKKFNFKTLLTLLLILALSFTFFACNVKVKIIDADYVLALEGLGETKSITKGEIANMKRTTLKEFDNSDKKDGPYSAVGVYLSDFLATFNKTLGDFKSVTLFAADGASMMIKETSFNPAKGGNELLIAYVYNNHNLGPDEESGSLRIVAPNNPKSFWVFKLNKISFNLDAFTAPAVNNVYFMENYAKTSEWNASNNEIHYGIKMTDLADVLTVGENGALFVRGYDFVPSIMDRDISIPKENYATAILSFDKKVGDGDKVAMDSYPVFEGPDCDKMMKMSNTLYIASENSAVLSLEMLFKVLDTDTNGEVLLKDVLTVINCATTSFTNGGNKIADKNTAKIIAKDGMYYIKEGNTETKLESLTPYVDPITTIPDFSFDVTYKGQSVKMDQTALSGLVLEERSFAVNGVTSICKVVKLSDLLASIEKTIGDFSSFRFVGNHKNGGLIYSEDYTKSEFNDVFVAFKEFKDNEWKDVRRNVSNNEPSKNNTIKNFLSIEFAPITTPTIDFVADFSITVKQGSKTVTLNKALLSGLTFENLTLPKGKFVGVKLSSLLAAAGMTPSAFNTITFDNKLTGDDAYKKSYTVSVLDNFYISLFKATGEFYDTDSRNLCSTDENAKSWVSGLKEITFETK